MGCAKKAGLASVIVPCLNQLEFTMQCLAALVRFTRPPWELIVVDNGSTDGTGAYLAGVHDCAPFRVGVVSNGQNLGFPAAINQGLRAARGEYLVLLNNDAVVTDGWLEQLIALAEMKVTTEGDGQGDLTTEHTEGTDGEEGDGSDRAVLDGGEQTTKDTKHTKKEVGAVGQLGIGLVGPMSNYAAPPQLVGEAGYRDLEEMHTFARQWRDERRGQWFTVNKLSGFCLLLKREVYEAVGGLDERFGLGFIDDDGLAVRARQAGFELAVAYDLFIHHFGSRTFVGSGIDAEKLLDGNNGRFAEKWGGAAGNGRRVMLQPSKEGGGTCPQMTQMDADKRGNDRSFRDRSGRAEAGVEEDSDIEHSQHASGTPCFHLRPSASSADRKRLCSISLTMIVRDEQQNLPSCLASVHGLFDEIVVVDTGSTDGTAEIAREFGARVFDFFWIDDFAAARNAALARATGDYAFWLDADDVVEPPQRTNLEELLAGLRIDDVAAYVVRCACDADSNGGGGQTVVDHIRLFPLRQDIRWSFRVHEQILPSLRRANIPVRWTDVTVRHTGYSDPELRARKLVRDARILEEELAERPDDPFVLFNLGSIAIERQEWQVALNFLKRSLATSAPTDSIARKLFALIARSYQMLGDLTAALQVCVEGLRLDPNDAELLFRKALTHRICGQAREAETIWRRILGLKRPEQFSSIDMGIYGHLTRRNLATLAEERGDLGEAQRLWRSILSECPGDAEALGKLERLAKGRAGAGFPG